jgi:hypothetical protein
MHWPGYDTGIVGKVGRSTSVVTVQVSYLSYVEATAPNYRVLCVPTRQPICNNTRHR